MRKIVFEPDAYDEYLEWQRISFQIVTKINELINNILQSPYHGIGKPEPLKHHLKGCWSRRITREHRLIYRVTYNEIHIISCKGHYE